MIIILYLYIIISNNTEFRIATGPGEYTEGWLDRYHKWEEEMKEDRKEVRKHNKKVKNLLEEIELLDDCPNLLDTSAPNDSSIDIVDTTLEKNTTDMEEDREDEIQEERNDPERDYEWETGLLNRCESGYKRIYFDSDKRFNTLVKELPGQWQWLDSNRGGSISQAILNWYRYVIKTRTKKNTGKEILKWEREPGTIDRMMANPAKRTFSEQFQDNYQQIMARDWQNIERDFLFQHANKIDNFLKMFP